MKKQRPHPVHIFRTLHLRDELAGSLKGRSDPNLCLELTLNLVGVC